MNTVYRMLSWCGDAGLPAADKGYSVRTATHIVIVGVWMAILFAAGCRTTLLGQNIWIRPATSFASRAVDVGDTVQVVLPEYHPRGDSFFVVVRVYPEDKKDKDKLTGANIREWPEMMRKKLSARSED